MNYSYVSVYCSTATCDVCLPKQMHTNTDTNSKQCIASYYICQLPICQDIS